MSRLVQDKKFNKKALFVLDGQYCQKYRMKNINII